MISFAVGMPVPPVTMPLGAVLPPSQSVQTPVMQTAFAQIAPNLSRQERRAIQIKVAGDFETALRNAATDKEARIALGRFLGNRHFSRLFLRREHVPLLLAAAKVAPVLLDMTINQRPSIFTWEHLVEIRAISPWAAMRLIAKRTDWQARRELEASTSPYENARAQHEKDVRAAQERYHRAIKAAGALFLSGGLFFVAHDVLEGTA